MSWQVFAPDWFSVVSLLLCSVNDKEVKDQLKANVAEALDLGAFGVPFIVIEDNVYFGSDRFEQMAFTHGLAWHGPVSS